MIQKNADVVKCIMITLLQEQHIVLFGHIMVTYQSGFQVIATEHPTFRKYNLFLTHFVIMTIEEKRGKYCRLTILLTVGNRKTRG